jgi:hypothetical protein
MLDRRLLKKVGFIENDDHILAQGLILREIKIDCMKGAV